MLTRTESPLPIPLRRGRSSLMTGVSVFWADKWDFVTLTDAPKMIMSPSGEKVHGASVKVLLHVVLIKGTAPGFFVDFISKTAPHFLGVRRS